MSNILLHQKQPVRFIIFMVLIHSLFLSFPPVNQEFAFVSAAQFFMTHNHELLDQFFTYQANTLGLPYLTYLLSKNLPHFDTLTLIRLINTFGIVLLIAGLHNIAKLIHHTEVNKVIWLVLLNPLIWTFSERATADFIPAALAVFSISLSVGKNQPLPRAVLSGLLLGVAAILKYHALSLLVLFAALLWINDRTQAIKKLVIAGLISVSIVIMYALSIHHIFGFWLTPDRYQHIHHVHLSGIANNFILYTGFLGLIALPTFFLSEKLWKVLIAHWKILAVVFCLLLALGINVVQDSGELNLGPLDSLLPKDLRIMLLSLMCLATFTLIYPFSQEHDNTIKKHLGIAILITLFAFSSSRPAQRYLLFVIPFFVMILPRNIYKSKLVYVSTIVLFIAANTFIELSRYATGSAAQAMVTALNKKHLLEVSSPGDVESHVGNEFYANKEVPKRFTIVSGKNEAAILTSSGGLFFYKKYFSLLPLNPSTLNVSH